MAVFDQLFHITSQEDKEVLRSLCGKASISPRLIGRALEVGSWVGGTTLVIAEHFPQVMCVDTWEGSQDDMTGSLATVVGKDELLSIFCRNMGGMLMSKVIPLVGKSIDWADILPPRFMFDLIWIDAAHDISSVNADIKAWSPRVRSGGILCGHDFSDQFPGVRDAVRRLIPEHELNSEGQVWWTQAR